MAPMIFAKAIMEGTPIEVFNFGDVKRDSTYIDDIVEGVERVPAKIPAANPAFDTVDPDPSSSNVPYALYNIGNHQPVELLRFIEAMETALGKQVTKSMKPMQAGDVRQTHAATDALRTLVGFAPTTNLVEGITLFAHWYCAYRSVL